MLVCVDKGARSNTKNTSLEPRVLHGAHETLQTTCDYATGGISQAAHFISHACHIALSIGSYRLALCMSEMAFATKS